jgi:hypothetical protein
VAAPAVGRKWPSSLQYVTEMYNDIHACTSTLIDARYWCQLRETASQQTKM